MKSFFWILILCITFSSCKEEAGVEMLDEKAFSYTIADESESVTVNKSEEFSSNDTKIIKNARLRYQTQDLKASYESLYKTTKNYKAYIQNDNAGTDYNTVYRNITLRVPNAYFDAFINDIGKGVSHFDIKEISAQDVTEEFVDVTARLKAKHTLENRYLEILKKANKVSEILEIEKELSAIREEIEVAQGKLKYLENRVAMSTISIEMYTEKAEGTGTTVSYGSKMWNAITSGFNGLSSLFLGMLHIWPFILIFVILFIFVRRKIRNKKKL